MISVRHLYKLETGSLPVPDEELEFGVFRSKGQWVIDIEDSEKMRLCGRMDLIRFERTDPDYLRWLEEKVETLTNQINENNTGRG